MTRRPDDRAGPARRPRGGDEGRGDAPRGAKPLGEILGDLFAAKGLARVRATGELEAAWAEAVGEAGARFTRVDGLRRGVLGVTVAHPTLLEEFATYQKPGLLASLRRSIPGTPILDIRFRIGAIDEATPPPRPARGRA